MTPLALGKGNPESRNRIWRKQPPGDPPSLSLVLPSPLFFSSTRFAFFPLPLPRTQQYLPLLFTKARWPRTSKPAMHVRVLHRRVVLFRRWFEPPNPTRRRHHLLSSKTL